MVRLFALAALALIATQVAAPRVAASDAPETIQLTASDGLTVTADVYRAVDASSSAWIVLAHQAMSSRGEYREIAPRLAAMGYNALALDQRSGRHFGNVVNETMIEARERNLETGFLAAVPDIRAGVAWATSQTDGPVVLWGSSYSAALAIVLAGEDPGVVDAVIAMSPGEYLSAVSVTKAAASIRAPILIASAASETARWRGIYAAIPEGAKRSFAPEDGGAHGSSALIAGRSDQPEAYWTVIEAFLSEHAPL